MNKLLLLVPVLLLFLSACNSESAENYKQMLGAYERNDTEMIKLLDQTAENINSESNRDKALQTINETVIPEIGDFRQTIKNYTLSDDEHVKVQKSMITYLDNLENLMAQYSKFNEEFFFVNPLADHSITEKYSDALDNISAQEEKVEASKKEVNQLIGDNKAE